MIKKYKENKKKKEDSFLIIGDTSTFTSCKNCKDLMCEISCCDFFYCLEEIRRLVNKTFFSSIKAFLLIEQGNHVFSYKRTLFSTWKKG